MIEFRSFCYLQNHKTGCTFVEEFLRGFCNEPVLAYDKHAVVKKRVPGKFYFTNVREPLALYRSLFAYGLDRRGTVFVRLRQQGQGRLYERGPAGFEAWLDFVLDPRNAPLLSEAYAPRLAGAVGFMTWRFLRLACLGFEQAAPQFASWKELSEYVRTNYLLGAVLRQEALRDELGALVRGRLAGCFNDAEAAFAWLESSPPINASMGGAGALPEAVDDALFERVVRKERLIYRNFYPDVPGERAAHAMDMEVKEEKAE